MFGETLKYLLYFVVLSFLCISEAACDSGLEMCSRNEVYLLTYQAFEYIEMCHVASLVGHKSVCRSTRAFTMS